MRKLRNRLLVAFLCMIFIPLLLISALFFAFTRHQLRMFEKDYGIEVTYDSLSDNAELISRLTESYITLFERQIRDDADRVLDKTYLDRINTELRQRYSFLLLRVDGTIVYDGSDIEEDTAELVSRLPDYQPDQSDREISAYLGGDIQALVKSLYFEDSSGGEASLFIVTSSRALVPQIRQLLYSLIVITILVLALTGLFLIFWIYRSVNGPLNQLKKATQNITEGNLDFTVDGCDVEEIDTLCNDFEDMRRRLKITTDEKMAFDAESKALISNISHDLKTPITAIKGYVEGIMDGVANTPEKRDKYLRTIYIKANEMDRLINELTFYSKIDTNRIPYTFSRISIADYFEDCAEELGMELEAQNIAFSYNCGVDRSVMVIADTEQLKRVINNIVSNSIKYMDKAEGRIGIRLRDVGDFVQVEMEDNGRGIAARDVPNIFERFYRTDASRNSSKGGSGIGLSIVRKILEDHGGKVWATSVEGEGTTIYFVLRKYKEVQNFE